jgi:Lrp/AsnC family transcriptional regulator for asnA, asnC and gidA
VDELDGAILQKLRDDARSTNVEIGRAVNLTEGAVRYRIARMVEDGTIQRYTIVTRPLGPEGVVLIRCAPGRTEEVVTAVRAIASEVFEAAGDYDVGASVERASMEEFNRALDWIRALPGVEATQTLVRLTRFRGRNGSIKDAAPVEGRRDGRTRALPRFSPVRGASGT